MNEQERSFDTTPQALQPDLSEKLATVTIPEPDPDIERLLDEGGLVAPEDD
jgi:type VI protein secretion system component VasA